MTTSTPSERELYAALAAPLSAISALVTQSLRALRPGKHLSYVELYGFDVDTFAHQGRCERTARADLPPLFRLVRDESGKRLEEDVLHGWFEVRWEGHTLEVISLSWSNDNCHERFSWVVAETRTLAEAFVDAVIKFSEEVRGQVLVFEGKHFRKSEELFDSIQHADFEELVLGGSLKEEVRTDVARFFARRGFYEEHRVPWKRGLLFIGPPGNGKTQTLKALLRELALPVLYVKTFKEQGEEARNIRTVFERARHSAPCVLVIEDLDCALDEANRSVFLNELDGFALNAGILTVATTNHPHKLDRSILDRPSRFDRKFHFPLPAAPERSTFISRWNGKQSPALRMSVEGVAAVVERTSGFTFAYLKELLISAALAWVEDARPGSMDGVAVRVARSLKKEMESAHVVLGPASGLKPIGFVDRTDLV
ncbi:MAG: AAA family ATPase [Myxococcaceae bacterium]